VCVCVCVCVYVCVCFHCHGTSSYHTTNTLQGRRAKSHVDTQTIRRTGTGGLRTIDPYRPIPHFPLLQNPGGATVHKACMTARLTTRRKTDAMLLKRPWS